MNDIEKEIERDYKKEENNIEEENISHKNNKKMIIWIATIIIILLIVVSVIYLILNNKDNLDNNTKDKEVVNEIEKEKVDLSKQNIGYVSCDDNTSLLNVRNSSNGDIVDGLSCYKEVIIEEELEKTETCDTWYKISYTKNNNNYTGYACGTYIKKLEISKSIITDVKELINKANEYYDNSILKAYCGTTSDTKTVEFDDNMTGEYVKSEYKTVDELKKYLLSFLDESLINKIELSDINNPKYNDDYYEIDGNLYCRNYAAKGYITTYTNNYDIEITSNEDDKINVNIAYEYLTEDSSCDLNDLSTCSKSNYIYDIGKITIEKKEGNYIITKMDFHK